MSEFSRLLNDANCSDGVAVAEIFSLASKVIFQDDTSGTETEEAEAGGCEEEEGEKDGETIGTRQIGKPIRLTPSQFIDAIVRVAHAKFSLQESTVFNCVRIFFEERLLKLPMKSAKWLLTIFTSTSARTAFVRVRSDLERIFQFHAEELQMSLSVLAEMMMGTRQPRAGGKEESADILFGRLQEDLVLLRHEISSGEISASLESIDYAMFTRMLCAEALRCENSPFIAPYRRLDVYLSRFIGVHKR